MSLIAGYTFSRVLQLTPSAIYFPVGVTLRAEVREIVGEKLGSVVLATLTTGDGLERVDDERVRVTISAARSVAWRVKRIAFDLVRTDVAPDQHYGFRCLLSVQQPVTASTDAAP